jgi:hypothetical protein
VTIHKCSNDNCLHRLQAIAKLIPPRGLFKKSEVHSSSSTISTGSTTSNLMSLTTQPLINQPLI